MSIAIVSNCRIQRDVLCYLLTLAVLTSAAASERLLGAQLGDPPVPASNGTTSNSAEHDKDTATPTDLPQPTDEPPAPMPTDEPPAPMPTDEPPAPMPADGPPAPTNTGPPTPTDELPEDSSQKEAEKQGDASNQEHDRSSARQTPGFFANLIRWLGKFHTVTVHFPIALLFVAALGEVLWVVLEKPGFRFTRRFCLLLAALGAAGSAMLGWFLAGFQLTDPTWIRTTHRWLGTSTAAWAVLTSTLSELSERRNSVRFERTFWATLFLGVALVGTTGFFGGAMAYGLGHYGWPTSRTDAETASAPAAAAEVAVVVEMTDQFTFEPEKVTIIAGETVLWKGIGNYAHTVTADPEKASNSDHVRLPEAAATFDSGRIQPGETFSYTFDVPGSYRYFCIPHELAGMVGEVEVKPKEK